jgi:hypothetical protein
VDKPVHFLPEHCGPSRAAAVVRNGQHDRSLRRYR